MPRSARKHNAHHHSKSPNKSGSSTSAKDHHKHHHHHQHRSKSPTSPSTEEATIDVYAFAPHQPLLDAVMDRLTSQPPTQDVWQRFWQVHKSIRHVLGGHSSNNQNFPEDTKRIVFWYNWLEKVAGVPGVCVLYGMLLLCSLIILVWSGRDVLCNGLTAAFPFLCLLAIYKQPQFNGMPKWLCIFWMVWVMLLGVDTATDNDSLSTGLYSLIKFVLLLYLQLFWFRWFDHATWFGKGQPQSTPPSKAAPGVEEQTPIVVEGEKQLLIPSAPVTEEGWQDTWQDIDLTKSSVYRVRFGIPSLLTRELAGYGGGPMAKCSVALWYQHGQPVMGAVWNEQGKTKTNFGWGGNQYDENITKHIQIITYHARMCTFQVDWVPYKSVIDASNDWTPVKVADCAPCVIKDSKGKEWLGKVMVSEEKASYAAGGKEHVMVGPQVQRPKRGGDQQHTGKQNEIQMQAQTLGPAP